MGNVIKRVPLDFDYPLNQVWYGYRLRPNTCVKIGDRKYCDTCKKFAEIKGIEMRSFGCPDYDDIVDDMMQRFEPPVGEGYQLWETISEGGPISPVFATLDELNAWRIETDI